MVVAVSHITVTESEELIARTHTPLIGFKRQSVFTNGLNRGAANNARRGGRNREGIRNGIGVHPNEVPSNFTAMVVHMSTAAVSSTCSLLLRTSAEAALECRQCNPDSLRK